MARLTDIQIREVFHFTFLERLLKITPPHFFALKGGVNLRFFLKSPRYSEDMDLDALGGAGPTLKKNVYKILEDPAFLRTLETYGISEIRVNDPAKAKQTETTQRFRLRLVNTAGEEFPTKVEFSRRDDSDAEVESLLTGPIDPAIASLYQRLSFQCQHYSGATAARQKIRALAGRPATQARDIFDLYLLFLGGHFLRTTEDQNILSAARERAMSISYDQYREQVVHYLDQDSRTTYESKDQWNFLQEKIVELLT